MNDMNREMRRMNEREERLAKKADRNVGRYQTGEKPSRFKRIANYLGEVRTEAAFASEQTHSHRQRDQDLHGGHTKIPQPRVHPQRKALYLFGVKEADVRHGRAEVTAADTGQKRKDLEVPKRRVWILQRHTCANCRDHQQRCGKHNRVSPARDPDKEGRWDPQRRAGQTSNRAKRKQLRFGKPKVEVHHLHGDDAPVKPDGKAAEQAGN